MAVNPMQRKARNYFLIGFLIAIVIMAVVVVLILRQLQAVKAEKEALIALQSSVFVASKDLKSGQTVTASDFNTATVITSVDPSEIVTSADFVSTDDDGNQVDKVITSKINIPAGTIVTKEMLEEEDDQTTASQRIQEFNMIVLPSQLTNGDYIDIRIALPSGQDYIVLSKKKVLGTTSTAIWLKLTEDELLTMNSAIVESYTINGSKLYAIEYVEPGRQEEATPTYTVSQSVLYLMSTDPNITTEAYNALTARYNSEVRVNYFETALEENIDSQASLVESGNSSEISAIQTARENYVSSLEGTEDIGYSE